MTELTESHLMQTSDRPSGDGTKSRMVNLLAEMFTSGFTSQPVNKHQGQ